MKSQNTRRLGNDRVESSILVLLPIKLTNQFLVAIPGELPEIGVFLIKIDTVGRCRCQFGRYQVAIARNCTGALAIDNKQDLFVSRCGTGRKCDRQQKGDERDVYEMKKSWPIHRP